MRGRGKKWTPQDTARLSRLRSQGKSTRECAAILCPGDPNGFYRVRHKLKALAMVRGDYGSLDRDTPPWPSDADAEAAARKKKYEKCDTTWSKLFGEMKFA